MPTQTLGHTSQNRVCQALQPFERAAREKHIDLELIVAENAPSAVVTDGMRVQQV